MSTLGWVHTTFGMAALLAGTAVIVTRKGTRGHRTLGHLYLTSMVGLNVTALCIYNLFGHFGPFHWLAASSLLTLFAGMVPVFTRRPKGRWLERHAIFLAVSYIGLVAATASEIVTRIPGLEAELWPGGRPHQRARDRDRHGPAGAHAGPEHTTHACTFPRVIAVRSWLKNPPRSLKGRKEARRNSWLATRCFFVPLGVLRVFVVCYSNSL